jgi:hypothetical protein
MQDGGRGGMFRVARQRRDRFAYSLDVWFSLWGLSSVLLKQDSSGLLLIRNVI